MIRDRKRRLNKQNLGFMVNIKKMTVMMILTVSCQTK